MVELGPLVDDVSLDLYRASTGLQQNGNLMISPLSMLYATVLVYLGAKGHTKTNMYSSLHFDKAFSNSNADVAAAFGQLMGQFKTSNFAKTTTKPRNRDPNLHFDVVTEMRSPWEGKVEDFQLTLANAIFVQENYQMNQTYLDTVNRELKAAAVKKDFKKKPEPARTDINQWVEERTGGKIKDLIPSGGINKDTRAVLTNAVYFKASWDKLFNEGSIEKKDFNLLDGKTKKVDMMKQWGENYPYVEEPTFQYLEISYAKNEASLLVFLPKDKKGLRNLEKSLTSDKLHQLASKVRSPQVDLSFPKFKFAGSFDMKQLLQKIGIKDVFDDHVSDLSGISTTERLVVSQAFHKTFIDLNEKGTEAAAASAAIVAVAMSAMVPRDPPIQFVADHPFMFAIRHNPSKTILFIGRVENP